MNPTNAELAESLKLIESDLRRVLASDACKTLLTAAARLAADQQKGGGEVRQHEVSLLEARLHGRAGPFTASPGERWVDADVALNVLRDALALIPQPSSTAPAQQGGKEAVICLVTYKNYPHFAAAELQLYGGYEPKNGDRLCLANPPHADHKEPQG